MKKFTFLFAITIWAMNVIAADTLSFSPNLLFSARLTGSEETPPVPTQAVGLASFALNATRDTMCIEVTVQHLSGPITNAHIHEGAFGVPGPPVIPLLNFVNGNRISAVITGNSLSDSVIAKFLNGMYYINVHTAAHPNGEIRGQIMLETETMLTASLNGLQVVPPVSTNGYGLAVFRLYQNLKEVIVQAKFIGLNDSIIGISLNNGALGTLGPEISVLDSGISGSDLFIELDPDTFISNLLSGNVYISVKTTGNPAGEIRGQVVMDNRLSFDMHLDAMQETPPTTSAATGVGYVKISNTFDTLWYDIVFDSLTVMPPTAAHFHTGPAGVPGPPVIDITSSIIGNRISGMVVSPAVNDTFVNQALMGNIYVNIHSTTNPNGEIRGQLRRYPREGFTYLIDGMQETPPLSVAARGSGLASVDYFASTLHFMIVVDSLTGIATAAHFHNALPGVAGPPVFTLTSFLGMAGTDDTLFGWWTDEDAPALSPAWADSFMVNHMYFNVHTVAHPSGEARGDIMLGGDCFETATDVEHIIPTGKAPVIYPNPSSGIVWINYTSDNTMKGKLYLIDVTGNTVFNEDIILRQGNNTFAFNAGNISNGIYFIAVESDKGRSFIGKMIKN
jgi:hypothetical protein